MEVTGPRSRTEVCPTLRGLGRTLRVPLLALAAATSAPAQEVSVPPAVSIASVGTTVGDLDRAVAFYQEVLGFEKEYEVELADPGYDRLVGVFGTRVRVAGMSLGPSRIELTEFVTPRGRPVPPDSRSHDEWFQHLALVVTDIERATARLREHGVRLVSPEPQRFPDGRAFLYFLDPDGHPLELAEFPGEKPLDPGRLFQRIDHTALVVRELEESVSFYRALGFRVESRAEGRSPAQQRLNNVFGAHLEIVSLRLPAGELGVELLHYLTPPGGRRFPPDSRPNDLLHRHITLVTPDASAAYAALRRRGADLRSPEVVSFTAGAIGPRRAFYVADPTGHVLELREAR